MKRVEVHKFGGTSLRDAPRIREAARLVKDATGEASLVVVASAMAGVTDQLFGAASDAAAGDLEKAQQTLAEIGRAHEDALGGLGADESGPESSRIRALIEECGGLLGATHLLGELTPRTRDRVVASGEKLSVRLLALALKTLSVSAVAMDADTFLETDDNFGEAGPLAGVVDRTIAGALGPVLEKGRTPVVTGFCGRAPDGATTTLGRGGSDHTATLIAAAMDASEVTIWTDVDGVYSADPGVVPAARVISQLNYREAAELSYYGAKVLHQRTMIPVASRGITVKTRNTLAPDAPGTVIDGRFTPGSHPVKAISAIRDQALVSIEGKGMAGVPGVAARAFGSLADRGISVTMISQSSSESSICMAVPADASFAAESALKREFRPDLSRGSIEEIVVQKGVGLVAAVGLGMARTPGVSGRVFHALGKDGINVLAIAQGSSELNISLALESGQVEVAVRTIHQEFGLHRQDTGVDSGREFDLLLVGCGQIGRAVADLVLQRRAHVFDRFGLKARIVAVADRGGYLFDPPGIPIEKLTEVLDAKAAGGSVAEAAGAVAGQGPLEMVREALGWRLARPVLVDVSDSADAHEAMLEALKSGCDVVSANKKPLAGTLETYRGLVGEAEKRGRRLKAEATVGAGLPVVDTLEMLLATGDHLTLAEGCLSGTLAFIMSRLEAGDPFCEAVAEAIRLGYTEPDPVTDLSGADVGRKAVILGRMSGLVLCDEPVDLESLVDNSLAGMERDVLLKALKEYDEPMAKRVREAADQGCVLRYLARVSSAGIEVGPRAVPVDSPFAGLKGTDNMISFTSDRYRDRPLVITGPGAGIHVTAMGVLGDIFRIAAERG